MNNKAPGAEQPRNRAQIAKATSIPHPALPLPETRLALFAPAIYKTLSPKAQVNSYLAGNSN
jgi:hypothetical protein